MIDIPEPDVSTSFQDAMTPMIDVIFCLITFMMLMINAPLLTMDIELPESSSDTAVTHTDKEIVTIGITRDAKGWLLNNQQLSSDDALKAELIKCREAFEEKMSLVINSDKNAPVQKMVRLFSLLDSLNVNVTHLALDPEG